MMLRNMRRAGRRATRRSPDQWDPNLNPYPWFTPTLAGSRLAVRSPDQPKRRTGGRRAAPPAATAAGAVVAPRRAEAGRPGPTCWRMPRRRVRARAAAARLVSRGGRAARAQARRAAGSARRAARQHDTARMGPRPATEFPRRPATMATRPVKKVMTQPIYLTSAPDAVGQIKLCAGSRTSGLQDRGPHHRLRRRRASGSDDAS